jgi:hypothetical protein
MSACAAVTACRFIAFATAFRTMAVDDIWGDLGDLAVEDRARRSSAQFCNG